MRNIIGEGRGRVTELSLFVSEDLHDFGRFGVWFGIIRAPVTCVHASRANVSRF